MTANKTITVKNTERLRLDVYLSKQLKISRSQAQKLIEQGQILVNGAKPTKTGQRTKEGDKIVISSGAERSREISRVKKRDSSPAIKRGPASRRWHSTFSVGMTVAKPKIISATKNYLVVEKPTGMLTHPTQANEKNALSTYLLKKYPELKKVGDIPPLSKRGQGGVAAVKNLRPGIVHRLDKEASGLLVVARTQKMFEHLKQQFKNRTVEKEYIALAHGRIAKDWDEITFPIARSENADRMAARPLRATVILNEAERSKESPSITGGSLVVPPRDDSKEKDAKTEFFIIKRFVNFTLLRVILHTGRMHQIRVHLLAYNHPLVGDPLYFHKKNKQKWDAKLGRLFLHSAKLGFMDLEGKKVEFESQLPKELEEFLKLLK